MLIKRKLYSSFMDRLKGNVKLRTALTSSSQKAPKDSDEVPEDYPGDLRRYLNTLVEFNVIKSSETVATDHRTVFTVYSVHSVIDQLESGKSPFGVQASKGETRAVLSAIFADTGGYVLAYYPNSGKYKITEESARFDFISRGVNAVTGKKGPQLVAEFPTALSATKYFFDTIKIS